MGETWEQTLTRRVRSLVRTGPLHRIESGKGSRVRDLAAHDLRALCLRVIDATIEHMGLGYGARRRDLRDALGPLVRAVEPGATDADLTDLTDIVVDHLLNESGRRLAFDEPYVAFDAGRGTRRAVVFHLLREEEADDGSVVLKATTEAINLYAGMLDVDVEDAQTAAEAVLRAQIERGAIHAAVATAGQARLRSIEYAEGLRQMLRQARRDVSQVSAKAVLSKLSSSRRHLDERLHVERALLDSVEDRLGSAGADDAPALVELKDALVDCRRRHLHLHGEVLGASEIWLAEQERQRFRRGHASALPDLERDVFHVLIAEPRGVLDSLVDPIILALHAPAVPAVLGLRALVESLLQPRRREGEADVDVESGPFDPVGALEQRFSSEARVAVEAHIVTGGTLGEMLEASRHAGEPPDIRRLLVLRLLWAWDADGGDGPRVEASGRLADLEYMGQDLTVGGGHGRPDR